MKESKAIEKVCPLLSSRDPNQTMTMCQGDDCMMWVTTFRPQPQDHRNLEIEGYCAFRRTNDSLD